MERETAMATLAAYLETLSSFSHPVVAEACNHFRRRSTRFPPTAGELYDKCAEIQHKFIQTQKAQQLRLTKPEFEYSEEHRAQMQKRFAALLDELKSGVNFNPQYGLVPKGTKPAKPIVERVVPGSFIDRWERENGRPYPMRDRVLALVNDQYREAAE
jgi:hypothetical protein